MTDREIPLIKAEKIPKKDILLDSKGFFVIEIVIVWKFFWTGFT